MSLLPTLKMLLFLEINFGNHLPNNFSKFRKFPTEISAVEFCYSKAIAFTSHCNFTYVSETSLGFFSTISQFKRYIITFIGNTFITILLSIEYLISIH